MSEIGERVWGRGSQDDKSGLIGELFARHAFRVFLIMGVTQASCTVSHNMALKHNLRFASGRPWRVCWRISSSQPEPWFWHLGSMKRPAGFM